MTSFFDKYGAMQGKLSFLLFSVLLFGQIDVVFGQSRTIQAPELEEFAACASKISNEFTVIAILSPGAALPNGNEFILQRSDTNGNFDNPIELARTNGPNNGTSSEQEIIFEDFSIPTTSNSDTYKIRIIASLDDDIISAISNDIAMHYFRDDIDIRLNNRRSVIFCNVDNFSKELAITILDRETGESVNPDDFEWEWFRVEGINTLVRIPGETGTSITVNSEGKYAARIPLGECQSVFGFARSNNVNVTRVDVDEITIETNAPDFSYCPGDEKLLTYSNSSFSYQHQWYKDDEPIDKATGPSITLPDNDFGGVYRVEVNLSEDCTNLVSNSVTVVNEGSSITKPLPEFLVRLPEEVLTLEIETDAPLGSTIRWIVDTNVQSSGPLESSTSSFEAPLIATYRVEIDADDDCNSELFSETEVLAPNSFTVIIGTDDLIDCEAENLVIKLLEINGLTNIGPVPLTDEQIERFNLEWFKDGESTGITTRELEINRTDQESVYTLVANLDTGQFTNISSDPLPILLLPNTIELTASPDILPDEEGATLTLTAPFNENFTYMWFESIGGERRLIEGETTNELIVSQEGDYFAVIENEICGVETLIFTVEKEGSVSISDLIPNVITPFGSPGVNDRWVLPDRYNSAEVEILIYTANGELIFQKEGGYNNEWPDPDGINQELYFYIIKEKQAVTRKGTITVMK